MQIERFEWPFAFDMQAHPFAMAGQTTGVLVLYWNLCLRLRLFLGLLSSHLFPAHVERGTGNQTYQFS